MSKFKTTGIDEMQKQVSLSLDDVTQLLAIKDEIVKEAEQEHTFSGAPKNSESKVKYIYKTEEREREREGSKRKKRQTHRKQRKQRKKQRMISLIRFQISSQRCFKYRGEEKSCLFFHTETYCRNQVCTV